MDDNDPTAPKPPPKPAEVVDFEARRMLKAAKEVGAWFRANPDAPFLTEAGLDALEAPAREAAEGIRQKYALEAGLDKNQLASERSIVGGYDQLRVKQELERYRTSPELFTPERAYALAEAMLQPPSDDIF